MQVSRVRVLGISLLMAGLMLAGCGTRMTRAPVEDRGTAAAAPAPAAATLDSVDQKVSYGIGHNMGAGLARDSDIMVVRQFGSSTCEGDFFHLVDRSSGIRGPTCVLGEFVPYRKPAGDAG